MGVVRAKLGEYIESHPEVVVGYVFLGLLQIARIVLIPLVLGQFVQSVGKKQDTSSFFLMLLALYGVSVAAQAGHGMFDAEHGTMIFRNVRQQTVEGVLGCFRRNVTGPPAGEIGLKVYQLAEGVYWMCRLVTMEIIPNGLALLGVLGYMGYAGGREGSKLFWITLAFVLTIAVGLGVAYETWVLQSYKRAQNTMDTLYGGFDDQLNNLEGIYVGNALDREMAVFARDNCALKRLYTDVWEGKTIVRTASSALVYAYSATVLYGITRGWFGADLAVAAVLFVVLRTEASVHALTKGMMQMVYYNATVERLDDYFTALQRGSCVPDAPSDGAPVSGEAGDETGDETGVVVGAGLQIQLGGVDVISQDREVKLNRAVTVIRGRIGSGKSTLARALAGLIPYSGSLRVHDHEIRATPNAKLPGLVYYVPQSPPLFDRTVLENITLGHASADAATVQALLAPFFSTGPERSAAIEAFLQRPAGRGGSNLSGGQRVMCYVTRALLSSSKVLVLDEPTAALDTQSARSLRESVMHAVRDEMQLVIITHDARPIWPEDAARYVVVGGALREAPSSDGGECPPEPIKL